MDKSIQHMIDELFNNPSTGMVLSVTGGGSQAITRLLRTPGASNTVLEVYVPYSRQALVEYLDFIPSKSVSPEVSVGMARASFRRALSLAPLGSEPLGIGCTAALTTNYRRRGEHGCFVSIKSVDELITYTMPLVKGIRDRGTEDSLVSKLILRAISEAMNMSIEVPIQLDEREQIMIDRTDLGNPIDQVIRGDIEMVTIDPEGTTSMHPLSGIVVLPGSFNPFHNGHLELAKTVSRWKGTEPMFEISVVNVDKPPLEASIVKKRLNQFVKSGFKVVVTRARRFDQKAKLLPGTTFVIGSDTAMRLVDPKYYGNEGEMIDSLVSLRQMDSSFLVAGRVKNGTFVTLDDVPVPPGFAMMFEELPESEFRLDISSTELRGMKRLGGQE